MSTEKKTGKEDMPVISFKTSGEWRDWLEQNYQSINGIWLKFYKKAFAFFETLNKTNRYSIAWRLQTAKKPETREKRIKSILGMLSGGEKFH